MIKRLNFTARRRIARKHISVEIYDGSPPRFDATIDLTGTPMPADARVFLEALSTGSSIVRRFDFGRVSAITPPTQRVLTDIDLDHTFFALKVVEDDSPRVGRILGIAEQIRPRRAGKPAEPASRGILPIVECDGLGEQLWDVDLEGNDACLRVNKKVAGLKDRARHDPLFYAVVYPAVIRQILTRAIDEGAELDEASSRWQVLWLRFGKELHPFKESPPTREDGPEMQREWVDATLDAFCLRHTLATAFRDRSSRDEGGDP